MDEGSNFTKIMSYVFTPASDAKGKERLKKLLEDGETVVVRLHHGSDIFPHGVFHVWDFDREMGPDMPLDELLDKCVVEFIDPDLDEKLDIAGKALKDVKHIIWEVRTQGDPIKKLDSAVEIITKAQDQIAGR